MTKFFLLLSITKTGLIEKIQLLKKKKFMSKSWQLKIFDRLIQW